MWGQTQHGPISIRTWHAWAAFHQKSAGVYPGVDWKHCVCQLVIWLIVPVVGGKSWQSSSDTCTSQGQTSWSREALRIWWVYVASWRLQRHVEMVFHAHPMSAHDTDWAEEAIAVCGKIHLVLGNAQWEILWLSVSYPVLCPPIP